jgi:hypothetical protein
MGIDEQMIGSNEFITTENYYRIEFKHIDYPQVPHPIFLALSSSQKQITNNQSTDNFHSYRLRSSFSGSESNTFF